MENGRFPFLPQSDWVAPSELPDLSGAKEIAIDLETSDPDLMKYGPGWATNTGFICGVGVAVDGWKGYFPIAHENGTNMDREGVLAWCKDTFSRPEQDKIFANATYDVGWLKAEGVEVAGKWLDVQVAAPLLDEHSRSYSLNALGERYLKEKKSESLMFDAGASFGFSAKEVKGNIHVLPPQFVGIYGEQDADLTLRLWAELKKQLDKEKLNNIFDVETSLLPVILEMRMKGVRVDLGSAFKLNAKWGAQQEQQEKDLKDKYGGGNPVDIWAAASIYECCERLGVTDVPRTPTGRPSFTSSWLEECNHPFFKLIKSSRKLSKGLQFLDQIISYADHGDGRIHAQIHPLRSDDYGTVSGRFSMSSPNLQQIPTRDPQIGQPLRSLFLPEEGERWISADYKSQETRILMSYVAKRRLAPDHPLVVAHINDPMADFHSLVANELHLSRFQAKTINLGIIYGMGKAKLAAQLGVTDERAGEILGDYHEKFKFVKKLKWLCEDIVNDYGKISTVAGRVCPDQNKLALLSVYEQGIVPKITIHDEICVSGDEDTQATVVSCMENAIDLHVPFKVESSIGDTWGGVDK